MGIGHAFNCLKTCCRSKNSDESEGFIKTPTRRREAEPTFDFFSCLGSEDVVHKFEER
jgi:hypothetical protein